MSDARVIALKLTVWTACPDAVLIGDANPPGYLRMVLSRRRAPCRVLGMGRDAGSAWRSAADFVVAESPSCPESAREAIGIEPDAEYIAAIGRRIGAVDPPLFD